MLLRLALATSAHHAAADEHRLGALDLHTVDAYRAFLMRVVGLEEPVEHAIMRVTGLDPVFVRERCKSLLLREDLRALGIGDLELASQPHATNLDIRTPVQALGWMFVLERQTLLSGVLCRHLTHSIGAHIDRATRYLRAYGERPGAKFREFGDVLGALTHHHAPTHIASAANEAFRVQCQWYRQRRTKRTTATASPTAILPIR